MNKKEKWILTIFLALPFIAGMIVAGAFKFNLERSDWITLVSSCIATFATILLGYMVFFQNENHKKRQEEENAIYQEQAEKNRKQELLIKANPVAYLKGIKRFDFSTVRCGTTLYGPRNDLTDEEVPSKKIAYYDNYFSFDLCYDNSYGKILDFITIKDAVLTCEIGNFGNETYKKYFSHQFKNYSEEQAIIKIGNPGECIALLQLYTNQLKTETNNIVNLLNSKELRWILRFNYILSNSCGVCADFESQIIFTIDSVKQHAFGINTKCRVRDIVTWQHGGIKIKNGKEENL